MQLKKLISGAFITLAIVLGIFYACKKDTDHTSPSPTANGQQNQSQNPNISARGTGTETIFSVDSSGTHYKMVLVWDVSGAVTVNRSIVTSGYPTGTKEIFAIDNNIVRTEQDLNADPTSFDTLIVTIDSTKQYYQIKFDLTQSNPAPLLNIQPMGYNLSCGCIGGPTACSLRRGSGWSYYCQGCTKCVIWARVWDNSPGGDDSANFTKIPSGGVYLVEATSVTILH